MNTAKIMSKLEKKKKQFHVSKLAFSSTEFVKNANVHGSEKGEQGRSATLSGCNIKGEIRYSVTAQVHSSPKSY